MSCQTILTKTNSYQFLLEMVALISSINLVIHGELWCPRSWEILKECTIWRILRKAFIYKILTILPSKLDDFSLCLTESGDLVELWPQTMLIRASVAFDYLVDDLVVIANDEDTIELILLTKSNEIGNRCMKIVEYPCMCYL